MFCKLKLLLPSGEGWETPTLLCPIERANLNHWNEPFRFYEPEKIPKKAVMAYLWSYLSTFLPGLRYGPISALSCRDLGKVKIPQS
jgi:hypothetical protein